MEGNQMFIFFGPKRHKGGGKSERPAAPQTAAPQKDGGQAEPAAPAAADEKAPA